MPESTFSGRTFAEPIPLPSTDCADLRLPATAAAIGFDLLASRTRRTRETRGARQSLQDPAERNFSLFAAEVRGAPPRGRAPPLPLVVEHLVHGTVAQ